MIFTKPEQIPTGAYDLIMADPPWNFKIRSQKGAKKSASAKYSVLGQMEIGQFPVSSFASDNCALWLWATNPMLPHALQTMEDWGFRFVTAGHWVKTTKHGKLAFGTGYCLRSAGEPFLIGAIGSPKYANNIRSALMAERREHSRKPDEAYDMAERLVPGAMRRLDMFSRQERRGWDAFGDEAQKFEGVV